MVMVRRSSHYVFVICVYICTRYQRRYCGLDLAGVERTWDFAHDDGPSVGMHPSVQGVPEVEYLGALWLKKTNTCMVSQ